MYARFTKRTSSMVAARVPCSCSVSSASRDSTPSIRAEKIAQHRRGVLAAAAVTDGDDVAHLAASLSAEAVAGAWAALLLAQTGMRYAEWATTASRVEQTTQNPLRIVKAVVDYLTTASQAKLRQTISYIVAKRRRQGFGHEEVITSMLLLRRSRGLS